MRYLEKTDAKVLREKYDYLIGWGVARLEFCERYNPFMYKLDYLIDKSEKCVGKFYGGMEVKSIDDVLSKSELKNKKVCFIIYPNVELEVIDTIKKYLKDFDTIVSRLVDCGEDEFIHTYSEDKEDCIFMQLLKKLHINNVRYMDIGVCHPVIRNNTYLMYENGHTNGILVEPNLEMADLIDEYRPLNKVIKAGVCAGENSMLKYYVHPNISYRGHNTFVKEIAENGGFADSYKELPVVNINQLFEQNAPEGVDILDIDTEGMDYDLLSALDMDKYQIKVVCVEEFDYDKILAAKLFELLKTKGYVHYMSTGVNSIYVLKKLFK